MIRYAISIDGGAHYSAPYDVPVAMGAQEYWLDAGVFAQPPTGADLIFFADTVGAGKPASSGTLVFTTTTTSSPEGFFIPPEAISEHSPAWSPAGYVPTIIEFNDTTSESGVIWVGRDGAQRKIFYDRLNANTAAAVSQRTDDLPLRFALAQNYPNPFNPATTIKFDLPTAGFTTLKVYSILGQEVTTLVNGLLVAGTHTVQFNARTLASGVYLYRLNVVPQSPQKEGGNFSAARRMVVVK